VLAKITSVEFYDLASRLQHPDTRPREDVAPYHNLGLRLGSAAQINEEDFVACEVEFK
jgi:hypothetical protein